MASIVIVNDTLDGARSLVDPDALPQWEARGWVALGGCSEPGRTPVLTDTEYAAAQAAEAARVAALLRSDAAPAPSRPSK